MEKFLNQTQTQGQTQVFLKEKGAFSIPVRRSMKEILTKYHSGDQVKKTEMGRTCGTYGGRRSAYRALVGKPEGRRPLGRPRRRWEDNIKIDLREVEWGGMDWINLAQDRDRWRALVNAVMKLRVP
jgi:hypothetical protein